MPQNYLQPQDVPSGELVVGDVVAGHEGEPYAITDVERTRWRPESPWHISVEVTPLAPFPGGSWRPMRWQGGQVGRDSRRVLIRAWDRAPYARQYGRISGMSDAQLLYGAGLLAAQAVQS